MAQDTREQTDSVKFEASWRFPQAPRPHASLALSGVITYVEAPSLRDTLFRMIRKGAAAQLVIELGALERIDTAGVAVLVEGLIVARANGQMMLFCEPSDRVRATFELAGLQEALQSCCKSPREIAARLTVES